MQFKDKGWLEFSLSSAGAVITTALFLAGTVHRCTFYARFFVVVPFIWLLFSLVSLFPEGAEVLFGVWVWQVLLTLTSVYVTLNEVKDLPYYIEKGSETLTNWSARLRLL